MNQFGQNDVHAQMRQFPRVWMSRNSLYALIGVLAIVVVALGGYMIYDQSQKPQLEIKVDKSGIQVNGNG